MRTTDGKATLERVDQGDAALAAALGDALSAVPRVERWTHGFHTYPAGLHADAARDLLAALPGDSVLDPFCGGGTVLVEAVAGGRRAHGRDLSPVAERVAWARTRVLPEATIQRYRSVARRLTEAARTSPAAPPDVVLDVVADWYDHGTLGELGALHLGLRALDEPDEVVRLLWVTFSSILGKVSARASDTSRRRVEVVRPPETTAVLFHKKARELGRRLEALAASVPAGTPPVDVARGDARTPADVPPVDLVLTSPPYPSVYDYLPIQDLRAAWLGDVLSERAEIGARRDFAWDAAAAWDRWRHDTRRWQRAAAASLRPGGRLVVVIGDGLVAEGPVRTRTETIAAGEEAALTFVASSSLARPDHARGAPRWEHAIILQKSD